MDQVLHEFLDVFPEELPNELPPLQEIQHTTDLVPSTALPNLRDYRINPSEHAELKRQVDKLLGKGLV